MIRFISPRLRPGHFLAAALTLTAASAVVPAPQHARAFSNERTYRVVAVGFDDVLNIRSGPSAGHPVIGEIPPTGRGVRLTGPCRGWCPISYNGASGWVHARYLAIEAAIAPYIQRAPSPERPAEPVAPPRKLSHLPAYWRVTGVAASDGLKVHGEPSSDAAVVHVFEAQAACIRLTGGCKKPWCQVKFQTGGGEQTGWVDSNKLSPSDGHCSR